jgi:uncharacterized protein YgfB (UPF0149 family)
MNDAFADEVGIFDFDELANHLLEQGLEASPAQLHGCLSGLLAAGSQPQAESGLDGLAQALGLDFHGELASRMMQLYTFTAAALEDEELGFYPLLPDDDVEIDLRTEALAQWCNGFLVGFAYVTAGTGRSSETLPEDSSEVLKDIGAMAQAAVDDEEEDDAEESYMELVEYLRLAVLNVFMDCYANPSDQDTSSGTQQPLH